MTNKTYPKIILVNAKNPITKAVKVGNKIFTSFKLFFLVNRNRIKELKNEVKGSVSIEYNS
jgi:hypothetical protein